MNPDPVQRYISSLNGSSKKDAGLDVTSLDILEQFAWEKYLSAYQICSNLKSTHLKLAYKNVNKRTNALLSSGLIQETEVEGISNKHRAKYYRLTEYGIYQLFLNRLNSLLINPSDVRKRRELSPYQTPKFFYAIIAIASSSKLSYTHILRKRLYSQLGLACLMIYTAIFLLAVIA